MGDQYYIDAAFPDPFTILGLRLRPLSIGHLILLHKIESPFIVKAEEPITPGQLALACLLCSKKYEDGGELLNDPHLSKLILRWSLCLVNQVGWRKFLPWLYRPIDIAAKLKLFMEYLNYHTEMPCFLPVESRSKSINAPSWQVVRVVLLSKTNLTDSEILNRPYRQSIADFLTLRAIEGQLDFYDSDELESARIAANKLQEQIMRAGNHD